jgi:3-hydroxymyristoyl/3-hydroxydecanoyl-(acyl carrier protein) dehydratase
VQVALSGERGSRLDLSAEIQRCEETLVVYRGSAELDGRPVGSLDRCVGPMLAMELFDDPATVRRHYEELCNGRVGRGCGARAIPDELPLATLGGSRGESLLARLQVPPSAPFFADHFPRWPVFPATLLLDAQARVAVQLAAEAFGTDGGGLRLLRVRDVRVRAFTPPGQALEILARLRARADDTAVVGVSAEADGKRIATVNVDLGVV